MTMMMGDDRLCAKAVNSLLTPREEAGPKIAERQVEEHPRCFLFGHYDSRGSACLVRAKNLIEAFEKYAVEAFSWEMVDGKLEEPGMREYLKDEYEAWRPDAIHGLLEEDFMFSCNVIVCDEPFGEESGRELDRGYDESGYRYGVLQYRWKHHAYFAKQEGATDEDRAKAEEFSKWSSLSKGCKKTLVFWKGKKRPEIDVASLGMGYLEGLEVRIVKKGYGEDAGGVGWIP